MKGGQTDIILKEDMEMKSETLMKHKEELEHQARSMGARFFGVADLTEAHQAIAAQGGDFLTAFPCALSVGIALSDGIVNQLPHHRKIAVARTYDCLYCTVNRSLDWIALHLSATLNEYGFQTLLIPASDTVNRDNHLGLFSHKLAAHLAGLGWIGPNCLLITPEVGPRVRWVTVLTDAPLEGGNSMANRCDGCKQCVDVCPAHAFSNRPFNPNEPREARFEANRCVEYRAKLQDEVTGVMVCGMCMYVCPYGLNKLKPNER
jgi:epoxyqueuosine reductase QueG